MLLWILENIYLRRISPHPIHWFVWKMTSCGRAQKKKVSAAIPDMVKVTMPLIPYVSAAPIKLEMFEVVSSAVWHLCKLWSSFQ